jgi:RHH-type proline utilization regulon transcriptional repressor/proline dehydrogenase/delta 1-pyrroline-5-carboxylate dehydrogenase
MDRPKEVKSVLSRALNTEENPVELAIILAEIMLEKAADIETKTEKKRTHELSKMLHDQNGKVFLTAMTDRCFRSQSSRCVAEQVRSLIDKYGIPGYLSFGKQIGLWLFRYFSRFFPFLFVPLAKALIRKETSAVIMPGEKGALNRHLAHRRQEGVRINLNHLGEAILGEAEAERRLETYLEDLKNPLVECVSVKVSTLYSQINLVAWDETLSILSERYRRLLRAGKNKFVNLDMEEFRDLPLTVALFTRVLSEKEFLDHSAGIVLQAYLPDSLNYLKGLTEWAKQRRDQGGAPIKIRLVKGANLAMEKVEAALRGWPQAPFELKDETDANFIAMMDYALVPENLSAVRIGIGSHNLFDMTYAMILSTRRGVQEYITFEMLEGMADPLRRALSDVVREMLLYCPAAKKEEFQNAVAYLVRRMDENTLPDNFLRHIFELKIESPEWEAEKGKFIKSVEDKKWVQSYSRRTQNRLQGQMPMWRCCRFANEPDTDFSVGSNREWAEEVLKKALTITSAPLPLVIAGKERSGKIVEGIDPSSPGIVPYTYTFGSSEQVEEALAAAERAHESFKKWPYEKRAVLLRQIANRFRLKRGDFIAAMIREGGKTFSEADTEVSEAIDFAEYYAKNIENLHQLKDITFVPRGPALVLPPWNFPCAIPAGGVLAALAAGCPVILKPAKETPQTAFLLAEAMWDAGVPRDVLQYVVCDDEPEGSLMVRDPRVKAIILTGASATARKLMPLQYGFEIAAETGGKNALYVSNLADRDLAIKDIIHSAFSSAGQKCSACSNLILHKELYDDPAFKRQLKEAVISLKVGSAHDPATKVPPLIVPPSPPLLKALTSLEKGEEWLVEPKGDEANPRLYSPGVKWGVKEGSFTHMTEFFGPLLGVLRANSLDHALSIANRVSYGLTSGIHTLDEKEIKLWEKGIKAGNLYVNRTITGAIVGRQPFGGTKESQFGKGAKAGGPNYVLQFMEPVELSFPNEQESYPYSLEGYQPQDRARFQASLKSYAFFWKHYFSKRFDTHKLLGQDNYFYYRPHDKVYLRVTLSDSLDDVKRVFYACRLTKTPLEISVPEISALKGPGWIRESDSEFIARIQQGTRPRVRLISQPSLELEKGLKEIAANVHLAPVMMNGRVELLHYLREVSFSFDYHRYGNLGDREEEERAPLPEPTEGACAPGGCR